MNLLKMLLAEIGYRKLNFALSLLAVAIAVTLFVAGPTVIDGYARQTDVQLAQLEDETRKLMKNLGFNLLIVNAKTDMSDFWAEDFAEYDMPQEYVERLAEAEELTLIRHLVATLKKRVEWENRKVVLVGYLKETPQGMEPQTAFAKKMAEKKAMGMNVKPGTAWLGFELGAGRKVGETITLLGEEYQIAKIMPEKGSKDDISISIHLSDAQAALNMPGRINEILALGCKCAGSRLPKIRAELADVLPETRVTEFNSQAVARAEQRDLVAANRADEQGRVEKLAFWITGLVVATCAVWVGLLALVNVRERREEIGILRAIGKGSSTILALFLGKAVLLGLLGAAVGFAAGSLLGLELAKAALGIGTDQFAMRYDILLAAMLGAPLLSAVASYLPTLSALRQDPAVVLRDH